MPLLSLKLFRSRARCETRCLKQLTSQEPLPRLRIAHHVVRQPIRRLRPYDLLFLLHKRPSQLRAQCLLLPLAHQLRAALEEVARHLRVLLKAPPRPAGREGLHVLAQMHRGLQEPIALSLRRHLRLRLRQVAEPWQRPAGAPQLQPGGPLALDAGRPGGATAAGEQLQRHRRSLEPTLEPGNTTDIKGDRSTSSDIDQITHQKV